VDDFRGDFHLMFANAMRYNVEGSVVWEDAQEMKNASDRALAELWF
jgi:ATP-dependent helicase STH1/SNF2